MRKDWVIRQYGRRIWVKSCEVKDNAVKTGEGGVPYKMSGVQLDIEYTTNIHDAKKLTDKESDEVLRGLLNAMPEMNFCAENILGDASEQQQAIKAGKLHMNNIMISLLIEQIEKEHAKPILLRVYDRLHIELKRMKKRIKNG